ncbi:MAG: hypothetical protein C0625_16360 [Arcobacter sp.]|nr:MAG: hypothetical protein C0625_16360 [Arcobacter sp.]
MHKKIIVNTFDAIFKNSNNLVQKLFIPILLMSSINYFIPQFISSEIIIQLNANNINIKTFGPSFLLLFLLILANISVAITTHRVIILGKDSVPKLGSYIFGLRELNFLFKSILLIIIILIPTIPTFFIPIIGPYITIVLALILFSRLSFIFPALACDEKMSFFQAWKYTKNHTFLTLFTIIIFPSIFAFSVGFIYSITIEFLIKLVSPHLVILYSLLDVFIMVFIVSALSSAYIYIKTQPLNKIRKENSISTREITETTRKRIHKIVIHDQHNVTFSSIKKELQTQYAKLNFSDIAYDRNNVYLLKNPNDIEAYVSLRYDNDEFIIQVNNSNLPQLKILRIKTKN